MLCDNTCISIDTINTISNAVRPWYSNADIAFGGWAITLITILIALYTIYETRKSSYSSILDRIEANHYKICNKYKDMFTYRNGGIGNIIIIWKANRDYIKALLEDSETYFLSLNNYKWYFFKSTNNVNRLEKFKKENEHILKITNYFSKDIYTWDHELVSSQIYKYEIGLLHDKLNKKRYSVKNKLNKKLIEINEKLKKTENNLQESLKKINNYLNELNSMDYKYKINQGYYNFDEVRCMTCMEYINEDARICRHCGSLTDLGKYFPYR